jgi:hypothetical protein
MATRFRRGLLCAAGLTGLAWVGPARAWDFEKPPGVPSEVDAARAGCPTVIGPCFGYFNTRWRVLGPCCGPEGLPMVPPTGLPPGTRAVRGAANPERPVVGAAGKMEVAPPRPARVSVAGAESGEKSHYGGRRPEVPLLPDPPPPVPLPEVRVPAGR